MDLSAYGVTGTNNPNKQISVTDWNNLLADLEPFGAASPQQYGAAGDGVTDDSAAFVAAIAYLKSIASNVSANGFYKGSPKLFVPAGHYFMGTTTLDITHTLIIEGEGAGAAGGHPAKLRWAAGATGIRVQRYNTSGADTVDGATHFAGDGTTIKGLHLVGGYTTTEGEYHGIQLRARATIDDCLIDTFEGDGIHINADALGLGADHGNANCFDLFRVAVYSCRNGVYANGGDSNAGIGYRVDCSVNRQWGIWDSSFLGNTWIGCHTDFNGLVAGSTGTVVSHGGNRYAVIAGQEAGATTNAPSGTTADNTWWKYMSAGGVNAPLNILAWQSGTTYRSGGSYRSDVVNEETHFIGCYAEGGQGPNQFTAATLVVGGMGLVTTTSTIRASADGLLVGKMSIAAGPASAFLIGAQDGGATWATFASGGVYNLWNAGTGTVATANTSGQHNVTGDYRVAGTKVVGARGAAIANATDAASAITQLNLTLAALRVHGLIAT